MNTAYISHTPLSRPGRLRLSALGALIVVTLTAPPARSASELWKINADGTNLTKVLDTPGYTCGSPEWSPDSKFIAYDTWKIKGEDYINSQIAIVRADGTDQHLIGLGAIPSWSPDGSQIVVHTYGIDGKGERVSEGDRIMVMNRDGTGRENVCNHWGSPRWMPTGNHILSILSSNLALYDLNTGKEHLILPHPYPMYWGQSVSPDGKRIVFSDDETNLFLATLDEVTMKATVRTIVAQGKCDYPAFAPDNKHIVFGWYREKIDRVSQLYTMDVDSEEEPKLLPGQDPNYTSWGPDWSPDGKTIVFCSRPYVPQPKPAKTPVPTLFEIEAVSSP